MLNTNTNRRADRIAYRMAEENACRLRCSRCPNNRNENRNRAPRRSWKFRSRKAHQYNG
jgi:hypothetical protein